jgi:hypothetical protein
VIGSLSSASGSDAIFEFNPELYNPLLNNLRNYDEISGFSEIGVCITVFYKRFQAIILTGFFLILITGH